jgi:hypothetical protein
VPFCIEMAQRELATEYAVALCWRLMGPVFTTRLFITVFTAAFTEHSLQHHRNIITTHKSDTRIQSYAIYTPMLPCPKSHLSASEASYSYTLSYACSSQPQNAGE